MHWFIPVNMVGPDHGSVYQRAQAEFEIFGNLFWNFWKMFLKFLKNSFKIFENFFEILHSSVVGKRKLKYAIKIVNPMPHKWYKHQVTMKGMTDSGPTHRQLNSVTISSSVLFKKYTKFFLNFFIKFWKKK